jgi:hypothetical protein
MSRRVMEGGEEEKCMCKIAKNTKGIECEREEEKEELRRREMGDDWFVTEISRCCFIVQLVYNFGR